MKLVIIWIISGLISFGAINANLKGQYGMLGTYNNIENYAFSIGVSFIWGPIALVISPFITGFYYYGWDISFPKEDKS